MSPFMFLARRRSPAPARLVLPAALLLGGGAMLLAGCGEDEPAECGRRPEGEFRFETDTPDTTQFTGTLQTATHYLGDDPVWEYLFRTNGNHNIQLLVTEVGPSVPVATGNAYSLQLVQAGDDPHESFGFRVTDAQGLRFMAVADWTPGYSVFPPGSTQQGYLLQGSERLVVSISDPGCAPYEDSTTNYRILRPRTLRFSLTSGGGAVELYNGQSATVGNWVVHVHKSMEVEIKNPALVQNQISFSVERAGLR